MFFEEFLRPRREISNDTILLTNLSSTTPKIITKPAVVASDILAGSLYTKPASDIEELTSQSSCITSYCCYDYDRNDTFICQEQNENQSDDCNDVLSSCQTSLLNICHIDENDIWCRIDQICTNETKLNCSIEFIHEAINASSSTTILSSSTSITTLMIESSTTTTTVPPTTTSTITTTPSTTTPIPTTPTPTTTTTSMPTTYRNKPSLADSKNDDLSKNLFYLKIRSFLRTVTPIHLLYLLLATSFFLLGIFYSILAVRGAGINSSSITNLNPLPLLLLKPHQIVNCSNSQISLLTDQSSLKFVILVILFYFILSGIESSCMYLTYLFGINFNLSKTQSLLLQFCYLFGRFLDILINYIWFLLNKYITKQSNLISIKFLVLLRLILLFGICVSNIFQQIIYLLFFSIGFFLTSISSLILYWIERDLCLNEILLRLILYTVIINEMIFPVLLFYKIEYFIQFYLFISLSLLISLFLIISYTSKQWERVRLYRLLPTIINMDEVESEENSDNERSKLH